MGEHSAILQAFVKLGGFLRSFCENENVSGVEFSNMEQAIMLSRQQNGWFTKESIYYSLSQWGNVLTEKKIEAWLSKYGLSKESDPKTIVIVMAGNIPLVGFHDFLSVLLTGNKVLCKLSSSDSVLLPAISKYLTVFEPSLEKNIKFTNDRLEDFDAVIATGSNNTSRYFEHYFGKYPNIIRKNRTSVAVLSGDETQDQLKSLGDDIFRYFGLGCRNVSKLFVPKGYDFDTFYSAVYEHKSIIDHHKYANNYDYNKAVYLMSEFKILDNGFLILKKDKSLHSPIASLFYEEYEHLDDLKSLLETEKEKLQCVVSDLGIPNEIPFGKTQLPRLDDYADSIDTVDFLLKL